MSTREGSRINQSKPKRKNWTDKETLKVLTLYELGYTRPQIAKRLGVTVHQITNRLKYCKANKGLQMRERIQGVQC